MAERASHYPCPSFWGSLLAVCLPCSWIPPASVVVQGGQRDRNELLQAVAQGTQSLLSHPGAKGSAQVKVKAEVFIRIAPGPSVCEAKGQAEVESHALNFSGCFLDRFWPRERDFNPSTPHISRKPLTLLDILKGDHEFGHIRWVDDPSGNVLQAGTDLRLGEVAQGSRRGDELSVDPVPRLSPLSAVLSTSRNLGLLAGSLSLRTSGPRGCQCCRSRRHSPGQSTQHSSKSSVHSKILSHLASGSDP
ncbi:hypothetical protein [Streptomyces albogriseolus]|uniref:hypothetical protein n=1 Tax=Streptomyces albogriseolus TaxID=1887 RepID=UPI0037F34589